MPLVWIKQSPACGRWRQPLQVGSKLLCNHATSGESSISGHGLFYWLSGSGNLTPFSWALVAPTILIIDDLYIIFTWGRLPLRLSSIEVVFHRGCLPLRSTSIEVVFHWGCLQLRLSFIKVVFNWGRLPSWSSSIVVIFHWSPVQLRSSVSHLGCLPLRFSSICMLWLFS